MGRCRPCESAPATGAAAEGTGCISVTGAGTDADPFDITLAAGCLPLIACTEATHPVSPAVGQPIFETDTDRMRVWDGALWRLTSPIPSDTEQGQTLGNLSYGPGGGPYTHGTLSITEPFGSGDPFVALVSAQISAALTVPGDIWDFTLHNDTAAANLTAARASGPEGWAVCTLGPCLVVSTDGSTQAVSVLSDAFSATGNVSTPDDFRFNRIRAQLFAL